MTVLLGSCLGGGGVVVAPCLLLAVLFLLGLRVAGCGVVSPLPLVLFFVSGFSPFPVRLRPRCVSLLRVSPPWVADDNL